MRVLKAARDAGYFIRCVAGSSVRVRGHVIELGADAPESLVVDQLQPLLPQARMPANDVDGSVSAITFA